MALWRNRHLGHLLLLLIKGLKNSSFLSPDQMHWIKSHTLTLVGLLFAASALILLALHRLAQVHPLKMVVLAGTFPSPWPLLETIW